MSGPLLFVLFLVWGLPICIGINLGRSRDRTGWAWGLLLGWLGVLILACMRPVDPELLAAKADAAQQEKWQRMLADVSQRPRKP